MSVRVRPAEQSDIPQILDMYEWLFTPPGSRPPEWEPDRGRPALVEAIAAEDSDVLVAEDDGELVGFCSAYLDLNSVRFGLRCWIEDLAVHPDRRSRGVGKMLLDAARAWGAQRGATHLELDSGAARRDAHRFYEREGPSWTGRQYAWVLR